MSDDSTPTPASFTATATAIEAIAQAMRTAHTADVASTDDPQQAIAALLLLREVREQLARWEPQLIETARKAGASWADLAHPSASPAARLPSAATCACVPVKPAPPRNSAYRPPAADVPRTAP
ncbi:hypothetical protein SAV14893_087890 [Streptomyces avermitilis]|uniref:Type III effector protein n=1 Tax=Streptomyces avermitilis TaxID=33903 RepID=A0A4D4MC49_STRAX|nr:hypothetical protein SAV14893_087890 [Streptomyces avermitilis]